MGEVKNALGAPGFNPEIPGASISQSKPLKGNSGPLGPQPQFDRPGRKDSPPQEPQQSDHGGNDKSFQGSNNKSSIVGELATQTQQVVSRFINPQSQQQSSSPRQTSSQPDNAQTRPQQSAPESSGNPQSQEPHGVAYGHQLYDKSLGHELNRDINGRPETNNTLDQTTRFVTDTAETIPGKLIQNPQEAASTVVEYLRGKAELPGLPPEVGDALKTLTGMLGRDAVSQLVGEPGTQTEAKVQKFIEHALDQMNRSGERLNQAGNEFGQTFQRTMTDLSNGATGSRNEVGRTLQQTVEDLVGAMQLGRYFARAEQTVGSNTVARVEESVLRLLSSEAIGRSVDASSVHPAELLRDLRSGLFLSTQDALSPFPLTGRARAVNEMIGLMHTLDAIERALQDPRFQSHSKTAEENGAQTMLRGKATMATNLENALDELFQALPTLPGRAGRNEMAHVLASLGGPLVDADGRTLHAKDGAPLKLDHLLWLSTSGGLIGKSFAANSFPAQLSPLIVYGFDAIYSLIGFDGRTLSPPHFAAVQTQINGSEMEWVFGQPPLSEGWMRALIERLKDSAVPDHNSLGEMLEEALAGGGFHAVLLQGSVQDGLAVKDSFNIAKLLPGASVETAFAPA